MLTAATLAEERMELFNRGSRFLFCGTKVVGVDSPSGNRTSQSIVNGKAYSREWRRWKRQWNSINVFTVLITLEVYLNEVKRIRIEFIRISILFSLLFDWLVLKTLEIKGKRR